MARQSRTFRRRCPVDAVADVSDVLKRQTRLEHPATLKASIHRAVTAKFIELRCGGASSKGQRAACTCITSPFSWPSSRCSSRRGLCVGFPIETPLSLCPGHARKGSSQEVDSVNVYQRRYRLRALTTTRRRRATQEAGACSRVSFLGHGPAE